MFQPQKCYVCEAPVSHGHYYCLPCLVKLDKQLKEKICVIENPHHSEHCVSCGEHENRRVVLVHKIINVCDKCIRQEIVDYSGK